MHNINEDILREYVTKIKGYNPKFLRGYASALYLLARFISKGEIQPQWVITTAETLTDEMRKEIEKKFQCEVFDGYGGEGGANANECPTHEGYHISMEGVVMEFLRNGESVSSGETGEIVVTDLNNYAMPFIRYRIGDLGVPIDEKCTCRRGLPMLKRIEGRVSDIIVTPSGKIITRPSFFGSSSIKKINGLVEYQIVQEKIDRVTINIVGDENFSSQSEDVILKMAKDILGDDVAVNIERVEKIPVAPSGKRKVVVSKVKYEFN